MFWPKLPDEDDKPTTADGDRTLALHPCCVVLGVDTAEIEAIDDKLRSQMIELARLTVTRRESSDEKIAALRDNNLTLQMRRAELLVENGFPLTWTDEIYSCPHCHDTGRVSSGICSCLNTLYNKELSKSLSSLLRSGDESFEAFDLSKIFFFRAIPGLENLIFLHASAGKLLKRDLRFFTIRLFPFSLLLKNSSFPETPMKWKQRLNVYRICSPVT